MARIIIAPEANSDLDNIYHYIAEDNVHAADRLVNKVEDVLGALSQHPEMGRSREELFPDLRCFPVSSYIIFYRPLEDGVEVARVLHASRDISEDYFTH